MKPRIAITLGDPAGIGPEVVSKALRSPRVRGCCEPVLVGDPVALAAHKLPLPPTEMLSIPGLDRNLRLGRPSMEAGRSAVESLRLAMGLVRQRQAKALVTAPVSKESFHQAGLRFPGHTEWLAQACGQSTGQAGAPSVAMLMVAGRLRALLMTRHIPLKDVSRQLTKQVIAESARLGYEFVKQHVLPHPASGHPLPSGEGLGVRRRPRLVACGLNPHAGDGGLIGREEKKTIVPTLVELKRHGLAIAGPIGADSVFRDMARGKYDLALAAYHDQGMIPLKLYAPDQLVNITLGLPFIRTSPGHGTAYDIAGKGVADPKPMIEAICLAAQYSG